jgi:hypothetical protein
MGPEAEPIQMGASVAVTEMKTIHRTVIEHAELRASNRRPERPVSWLRSACSSGS